MTPKQIASEISKLNPEQFIDLLGLLADEAGESSAELQSAWQDDSAGNFWFEVNRLLSEASDELSDFWDSL